MKRLNQSFFDELEILENIIDQKNAKLYLSKYQLKDIYHLASDDLIAIGLSPLVIKRIISINACIEIVNSQNINYRVLFNASNLIYDYFKNLININQECFYVLYLNYHKYLIKKQCLFTGTINYTTVHPREIFKEAYLCGASFIICVHNHPSGETNPSGEDIKITKTIQSIGKLHSIILLDHIIIGNGYYSFFESHML